MKKINFKSIIIFNFKGQKYEAFKTNDEKLAFLKIVDGKYEYPTLTEFRNLVSFLEANDDISFLKKDKAVQFVPCIKGKLNGKITTVALTSMLAFAALTGCAPKEVIQDNYTITVENNLDKESVLEIDEEEAHEILSEINDENALEDIDIIPDELKELFEETTNPVWVNADDIQDNLKYSANNIDFVNDASRKRLYLFNDKYFDVVFGSEIPSTDDLYEIIDNNEKINEEYKDFIKDYTKTMVEYYDGIDTRMYAENLKDLSIRNSVEDELEKDAAAAFEASTKEIIMDDNIDLENMSCRSILRHELSHMFNYCNKDFGDYTVTYRFNYNTHGRYLKEGLNVIFSTRPFEEEYGDHYVTKGYSILENITNILIESTDYDIKKIITGNVYDFEYEMNVKSNSQMGFNYIEDIYEFIWDDYKTFAQVDEEGNIYDEFSIDQEYYEEFYSYLTKLYLNRYADPSMSEEDIDALRADFTHKLTKNVTNIQVVDYDQIQTEFANYKELLNSNSFSK